jgi:hypothetical protein
MIAVPPFRSESNSNEVLMSRKRPIDVKRKAAFSGAVGIDGEGALAPMA